MAPWDQRLGARNLTAAEANHGLELEAEFAAVDRTLEVGAKLVQAHLVSPWLNDSVLGVAASRPPHAHRQNRTHISGVNFP